MRETTFMKKQAIKALVAGGFGILLAAALAGCNSCKPGKPGPIGQYNIEVGLDEPLRNGSVIVDLAGVNPSSLPGGGADDMGKYWKEGGAMGRDAEKKVLGFGSSP